METERKRVPAVEGSIFGLDYWRFYEYSGRLVAVSQDVAYK
jgi:hypothetical protein